MRRAEAALDRLLAILLPLLLAALVGLTLAQVELRYVFGASLGWAEEGAIVLMICLAWAGVALLWLRDAHIGIEWLPQTLPPGPRRWLLAAIDLLALVAAASLVVLAEATIAVYWTIDLLALGLPAAVKYLPVQAGAALLALAALLRLVRRLQEPAAHPAPPGTLP
jgi:TRAP-type C4-dicarboxylate transport system permease small subunit